MTYLTLVGMIMFPLFIIQEAIQTTMFGTWPAQDVQQWHIVKNGIAFMQKFSTIGKTINYSLGWIQPFGFFAYKSYFESADFYTAALEAKCFAKQPELFIGEDVTFNFRPRSVKKHEDGSWSAKNGKITVIFLQQPDMKKFIMISGSLNENMQIQVKN